MYCREKCGTGMHTPGDGCDDGNSAQIHETEISPIFHSAECPAGQAACVLPVNVNISLQYKGAGALTDVIVSIDVYPKNITINSVTTTGLTLSLPINT